jgi:hypothetical protein
MTREDEVPVGRSNGSGVRPGQSTSLAGAAPVGPLWTRRGGRRHAAVCVSAAWRRERGPWTATAQGLGRPLRTAARQAIRSDREGRAVPREDPAERPFHRQA